MTDKHEHVHLRSKEFLYKNVHYPPGWYFYDEEEDLYGPFLNKRQAERGLQIYLRQLEAGVAPTQTHTYHELGKGPSMPTDLSPFPTVPAAPSLQGTDPEDD